MSGFVTVITAPEVLRYNITYHRDKVLHIGAVTVIVNKRDHTLQYAIEEEIKSKTVLINKNNC